MKDCIKNLNYSLKEISDTSSFVHNFDVSIVMPFYKKLSEFKKTLPINLKYFQRNGIEIIISMDDDNDEFELLNYIKTFPFINWKIIVNHNKHEWRNPVKAINVGIRNATKKFILVCSPESEFISDVIYMMRKMLSHYDNHFAIGTISFTDLLTDNYEENIFIPYGSIMAKRSDIIDIGGYDETITKWGGDDDNIRIRLEMKGIRRLFMPEVKLIHRENKEALTKRRKNSTLIPVSTLKKLLIPNKINNNTNNWGRDFSDIVFTWENKEFNKQELSKYLTVFKNFVLHSNLKSKYDKILLVQSYNESSNICRFLKNNAQYFDAIILLDDGSTDNTYEIANHNKIILKVKKKRVFFNDLENRNILLNLASFFNYHWICFLDVDEIIDKRYCDFSFTLDSNLHNILFNLVHLWDSTDNYNADYPYSNNGIQQHYRMFRNIGYMQIITHKSSLHFKLTPYITSTFASQILLLHYGNISKDRRETKYKMYKTNDKYNDQLSYEHIINNSPRLKSVVSISL